MKKLVFLLLVLTLFSSSCQTKQSFSNFFSNSVSEELNDFSFNSETINSELSIESESNSEIENEKIFFDKQYSVYINPSVQYSNTYIVGNTNEGYQMNKLAILLVNKLKEETNLLVYANISMPGLSLSNSLNESNSLNVDAHIALHSNGGGGKGSEAYYKTNVSKDFASIMLVSLNAVLPYKTRGVKYSSSLYETNVSKADVATLIEILFHDEKTQAMFIMNNLNIIADALFIGIVNYFKNK